MPIRRKLKNGLRLIRSQFTENSAILLYHRVAETARDPFNLCVTPDHFAEQMEVLRRIATPFAVDEFVRGHRDGDLPKNSICVTFDDGFVDVLENAVPILEKYEIPAVVYGVTGYLGRPIWWDRVIDAVFCPSDLPDVIDLSSSNRNLSVPANGGARDDIFKEIYSFFLDLPPAEREDRIPDLEALTGRPGQAVEPRLMTEEEWKKLADHPLISVGGHTVSHSRLADLTPEDQAAEIRSSVEKLSEITGAPVTTFSYPFGIESRDYTAETMAASRDCGLDHVMAADLGVVSAGADLGRLPRLWIHDADGASFQRKMKLWL